MATLWQQILNRKQILPAVLSHDTNKTIERHGMLTLDRKEGESIIVYKDDFEITITLSEIKGKHAKISIDAPDEYHIAREELMSDE